MPNPINKDTEHDRLRREFRQLRAKAGLSQRAAHDKLHLAYSTRHWYISAIENGTDGRFPSAEIMRQVREW